MKKILLIVSALSILCGYSTNALGCMCGYSTAAQIFHDAKVVFVGKVTKIARTNSASVGLVLKESGTAEVLKVPYWEKSTDDERVVTLEISETFKGTTDSTVSILTSAYNGGGNCGVNFKKGESYLVYAYERRPELSSDQANLPRNLWTREIELKASADQFNARLPALQTNICARTGHLRWSREEIEEIRRVLKDNSGGNKKE